jgi:signal transduction histidine kinase
LVIPSNFMARLAAKVRKPPKSEGSRVAAGRGGDKEIVDAIEEEHAWLAQELHDSVCQSLSGLRLSAAALRRKSGGVQAQAVPEFAHLEEVAAKSIGELHEIVRLLQPVEILPAELPIALEEIARENRGPIECSFRRTGRPMAADAFVASQIARIARAAVRHARSAENVRKVVIEWQEVPEGSLLQVIADQPGFTPSEGAMAQLPGWKLLERRIAAIGARLTISQDGTSMQAAIPAAGGQED